MPERIRVHERKFGSHRLGYHDLVDQHTLDRHGILGFLVAKGLPGRLAVVATLRRTPCREAQRLIVGLRRRYAPQERLEHRCACRNLDVCENIPLRIVLFTRIGTGGNRHPAAVIRVSLSNASLEHHSANAVREARRLHKRVVPLVVRRFRVISELRIVIGVVPLVDIILAKHAREVETEASPGTECNRIVERTPFKLVCGHDVPAPPTAVIKLWFIKHLHACNDYGAVQRIKFVGGALASRSNDTGIHEQTNNPAYRCAKSHQDVCGSLSPRGIIHVLEPDRLAKIGPKVSNIQILSEASDIVICDRRRHIDSICHNLHPKHGIGMRIFPREREERDAVQERRTDGHRLVLGATHRLKHNKAVLDLHVQRHETIGAPAATSHPVFIFTAARCLGIIERTAAAATTGTRHGVKSHCFSATCRRGRILTTLTATAFSGATRISCTLTPDGFVLWQVYATAAATAAAEPYIRIFVTGNQLRKYIADSGFTHRRKREAISALAAI